MPNFKKLSIPSPKLDAIDRFSLSRGMYPSSRRVWHEGRDITDRPVSEWPHHAQEAYANGWRPVLDLDGTFME